MALSITAKPSSTAWVKDALNLVGMFLLWIICVIKLYKDFAHMHLDQRFLFGVSAWLLLAGICQQTPKLITKWKASNA